MKFMAVAWVGTLEAVPSPRWRKVALVEEEDGDNDDDEEEEEEEEPSALVSLLLRQAAWPCGSMPPP